MMSLQKFDFLCSHSSSIMMGIGHNVDQTGSRRYSTYFRSLKSKLTFSHEIILFNDYGFSEGQLQLQLSRLPVFLIGEGRVNNVESTKPLLVRNARIAPSLPS